MRFKHFAHRTSLLFLSAFLLAFTFSPAVHAEKGETRTVRVAFPIQTGLTDVEEDGSYSGYTYEFLEEIAQYTGWDYEFVPVEGTEDESLSASLQMLEDGEADLMGGMLYSEELGGQFTYSGQSYGTVETVLQTSSEKYGSVWINSQLQQSMRIAVFNTAGRSVRELEEYCRMNLIEPEYVLCRDEAEQLQAIEEGRADALLNTSLNYLEGTATIARFSPKPFYFITGRDSDPELMDELDKALLSIGQSDPYFSAELFEKYFAPQNNSLRLTEEEQSYVAEAGEIRVGYLPGQPPFQWEEANGQIHGITKDLIDNLSEKTGLRFQMVAVDSVEELFARAETGELDLMAGMPYEYSYAREHHMAMTRPYLSSQYMLVMSEETGRTGREGKRLALPATSYYGGYTIGDVVWFESRSACVKAVNEGRADYTYVDACTAQYYFNQPEYWDLQVVPLSYEPLQSCFGVPKPADQELLTILNKVIRSLSTEEIQTIIIDNTYPASQLTLSDFMRAHPIESISVVAGILFLIIALLGLLLLQRAKNTRAAALELKKRLRVYTLANDYFFEYDHRAQSLVVSVPSRQSPEGVELRRYQCPPEAELLQEKDDSFWRLLRTRRDGIQEFRQICERGRAHWLRMALETICDKAGNPVYAVGKLNLIDTEREEKVELETKALLDGLTGIFNAKSCQERITELLSGREEASGAFLLLDIDKFKSINDTYGHSQGNMVLRRLAGILQQITRSEDIVGRFGGDEFIVYLAGVQDEGILEKRYAVLREKVRRDSENGDIPPFTVSIGVAFSSQGMDYNTLLQSADAALYMAKARGRDCFAVSDGSVGRPAL